MSLGHCCFGGCELRRCGCCFRQIFHNDDCVENPGVQLRAIREGRTPEEVATEIRDDRLKRMGMGFLGSGHSQGASE